MRGCFNSNSKLQPRFERTKIIMFMTFYHCYHHWLFGVYLITLLSHNGYLTCDSVDKEDREAKGLEPFIAFGKNLDSEEYIYIMGIMAAVNGKYKFTCTGTLISEKMVLTAAHCKPSDPNSFVRVSAFKTCLKKHIA